MKTSMYLAVITAAALLAANARATVYDLLLQENGTTYSFGVDTATVAFNSKATQTTFANTSVSIDGAAPVSQSVIFGTLGVSTDQFIFSSAAFAFTGTGPNLVLPIGSFAGSDIFTGLSANLRVTAGAPAATGSVPEPASWATMVGGFGLLGAAMRRRRSVPLVFA